MAMSKTEIELFDIATRRARKYAFTDSDTIGELRKNIAKEELYDGPKKVKVLLTGFPLPDQLLVKDFMDTELGVEFATYSVTCTSDDDIYVWAGVKKCIKLEAGTPETFKLVGSGWGKKHLAVCRSK